MQDVTFERHIDGDSTRVFSDNKSFSHLGRTASWSTSFNSNLDWNSHAEITEFGYTIVVDGSGSETKSESSGSHSYEPGEGEYPSGSYRPKGQDGGGGSGESGGGDLENGELGDMVRSSPAFDLFMQFMRPHWEKSHGDFVNVPHIINPGDPAPTAMNLKWYDWMRDEAKPLFVNAGEGEGDDGYLSGDYDEDGIPNWRDPTWLFGTDYDPKYSFNNWIFKKELQGDVEFWLKRLDLEKNGSGLTSRDGNKIGNHDFIFGNNSMMTYQVFKAHFEFQEWVLDTVMWELIELGATLGTAGLASGAVVFFKNGGGKWFLKIGGEVRELSGEMIDGIRTRLKAMGKAGTDSEIGKVLEGAWGYGKKVVKAVPESVINAIKTFGGRRFVVNGQTYILDKKGLRHFLERHHPDFWNGTTKQAQSFFGRGITIRDIEHIIEEILKQNKGKVAGIGTNGVGQIEGIVNGIKYVIGLNKGRIGQLYPLL